MVFDVDQGAGPAAREMRRFDGAVFLNGVSGVEWRLWYVLRFRQRAAFTASTDGAATIWLGGRAFRRHQMVWLGEWRRGHRPRAPPAGFETMGHRLAYAVTADGMNTEIASGMIRCGRNRPVRAGGRLLLCRQLGPREGFHKTGTVRTLLDTHRATPILQTRPQDIPAIPRCGAGTGASRQRRGGKWPRPTGIE